METVSLLAMLGILSYEDVRWRRIEIMSTLGFAIVGVVLHMLNARVSILSLIGGIMVGAVLLAVSVISNEKIGKGDAFIVMVTGIYVGFWANVIVLWLALLLAGIFGIVLIVTKSGQQEIPFVPFLLTAYVLLLIIGGESIVS